MVATGKLQLGQLADDDRIAFCRALKIVDSGENQVQAVSGPLARDGPDGVNFRNDCFVECLGKSLPEGQRTQIVELAASDETMAEIGLAGGQNGKSALLAPALITRFGQSFGTREYLTSIGPGDKLGDRVGYGSLILHAEEN